MTYRPKNYTKAERVFKLRYSVKVPKVYTLSPTFLEQYQIPSSGDDALDHDLLHQPIDMLITPAGVAMYLADGANLEFNNPDDVITIYNDVRALLEHVAQVLNNSFVDTFKPPIKDIVALDQLCKVLYPFYLDHDELKIKQQGALRALDPLAQYMSSYAIRISPTPQQMITSTEQPRKAYVSVTKLFTKSTWGRYGNTRHAPT